MTNQDGTRDTLAFAASALLSLIGCASSPTLVGGRALEDLPVLVPPRHVQSLPEEQRALSLRGQGYIDFGSLPEVDVVQLRLRPSFFARRFAVHPYFLVYRAALQRWDQWEVWAGDLRGWRESSSEVTRRFSDGREREPATFTNRQHGTIRSWQGLTYFDGHRHERVQGAWTGDEAARIIAVLECPGDYPWVDSYRIWPGPNSNTYAAWVLEQARVPLDLGPKMVGKDWRRFFGAGIGLSPTRTGLRADLPGVGAAIGLGDGVELHLLGATLGVDIWPPAIKTPLGRLGFSGHRR